jgi:phosphopantothenoylcysteine decarboxylase
MAKVLLGVTGSVAAVRVPELFALLQQAGHQVKVVSTRAAPYFFHPGSIQTIVEGETLFESKTVFFDDDEWPGKDEGVKYQRDDPVLHIELRRWADLLLVAPLDANTLAKFANGLADNCLTSVWRAWEPERPIVLAPAMNTLMWQHPLTARHFRQLVADPSGAPGGTDPDAVVEWINRTQKHLRIVPPQTRRLACGDVGIGALADLPAILAAVRVAKV